MLKLRGSLTIEASIIVPMVLAVFAMAMRGGINLYQETRDTAVTIAAKESPDILKRFYEWNMLEGLADEQKED
jgi:hypothetical protein